jgi:hypothetical protein
VVGAVEEGSTASDPTAEFAVYPDRLLRYRKEIELPVISGRTRYRFIRRSRGVEFIIFLLSRLEAP